MRRLIVGCLLALALAACGSEAGVPTPLPTAVPPNSLPEQGGWAVTTATLALAVLTAAAVVGIAWSIWRRSRPPASRLAQLAREAQDALHALQAGTDVRDTVMRCYFEMSRILSEQRGVRRAEAMTPREFERRLRGLGLPEAQIDQLTGLFEGVRYGARIPGGEEERQAIACLAAIADARTSRGTARFLTTWTTCRRAFSLSNPNWS